MARPDVEYAQAAYRVYPYYRPNDPLYSNQWNFPAIGMEQAWDINQARARSIIVAVLDTGVAYTNAIYEFTGVPFELDGVRYPALGPGHRAVRGRARVSVRPAASSARATSSGTTTTRSTSTATART